MRHAIEVHQDGEMTLPADVLDELGVRDGGQVLLERQGNTWALVRADDPVSRTAGEFAEYARNGPIVGDRDRIWTEIAQERWNGLQAQVEEESEEPDRGRPGTATRESPGES